MSFRDARSADLRCAIAHRGISRFRVRVFDAPRNDEVCLRNARDHFGCAEAVAAGFFRLLMTIVISRTISRGRTPLSGWWIAPDSCDCSARLELQYVDRGIVD